MAACRAAPPPRYHSPSLASVNRRCMALTVWNPKPNPNTNPNPSSKIALQFFIY